MSWLRAIFAEQIRNCCASNAIAFRSTRRKRRQRTQLTLQNEEAQLSLRASVREEAKVLELEHQLAAAEDLQRPETRPVLVIGQFSSSQMDVLNQSIASMLNLFSTHLHPVSLANKR